MQSILYRKKCLKSKTVFATNGQIH
jgi:hypothetical protein